MRRYAGILIVVLLLAAAFVAGVKYGHRHEERPASTAKASGYHCPMHPSFRSDKPGDCGICGMKLVPDDAPSTAAPAKPATATVLHYRDPKDHSYTSDKPGVNPATGNDLEPVYAEAAPLPPGTIHVSAEKQQLIGVRYGQAEYESATQAIRAVGRVTPDETRIVRVQTRIDGWIEQVLVNFTGKFVEKGQPLLTLYSPEMLATQQEYLLALRSRDILQRSPLQSARESSGSLIDAARRRLQLLGLSDAQVAQVEQTQKPLTNVTLHAPISGYITERNAFPKQRITPETALYTIVDLSTIWVMADVYEAEAAAVRLGAQAVVTVTAYPGRRFPAKVSYIQPALDPNTRTLRVRLELKNPNLALKPDMFVNVELSSASTQRLVVPAGAVLNSGTRQTVFVDRGDGHLEPRQVQIGTQSGDRVEILGGLRAGERIVTSGTFLIDSESQLKAAASGQQHD